MSKLLKSLIFTSLIMFVFLPSLVSAAWYNPFTWFKKISPPKSQTVIQTSPQTPNNSQKTLTKPTTATQTTTKSNPQKTTVPAQAKLTNTKIIQKVKPSVVYIETNDGSGSGMIISADGYILTNAHVVEGFNNVEITLYNKKVFQGVVVGRDENIDLAIIKINPQAKLTPVEFGDSDKIQQGDAVFTLGFPFGIKGDVSFKDGTLSRKIEDGTLNYLEISAEIHPGNSGGPLVDSYGKVVGINTAVLGQNIQGVTVGETIKLVIPINVAIKLLPELKSGINRTTPKQDKNTDSPLDNTPIDPPTKIENNLSVIDSWYETYALGENDTMVRISSKELRVVGIIKNNSNSKSATNIKLKITLTDTKTGIKQEELITLNHHKYMMCIVGKNCELIVEPQQNAQFKEKIKIYDPFIVKSGNDESLKKTVSIKIDVVSADW